MPEAGRPRLAACRTAQVIAPLTKPNEPEKVNQNNKRALGDRVEDVVSLAPADGGRSSWPRDRMSAIRGARPARCDLKFTRAHTTGHGSGELAPDTALR